MKKILIVLVALLLVSTMGWAADVGYPQRGDIKTQAYSITRDTSCAHITTSPAFVYRITLRANTAAGWLALYDSSSSGSYAASLDAFLGMRGTALEKVMVGEATQYDCQVFTFNPPIYFQNGIYWVDGIGGFEVSGGDGVDATVTWGPAE